LAASTVTKDHVGSAPLAAALAMIVLLGLRLEHSFVPLSWVTGWGVGLLVIGITSLSGLWGTVANRARHQLFVLGSLASVLATEWHGPGSLLQLAGFVTLYVVVTVWTELQPHDWSVRRPMYERELDSNSGEARTLASPSHPQSLQLNRTTVADSPILGDVASAASVPQLGISESDEALERRLLQTLSLTAVEPSWEEDEETEEVLPDEKSNASQWNSRSQIAGADKLEGWVRVQLPAGQKSVSVHVPFSPAFSGVPQVECEPIECESEVSIRASDVFTYGMRMDLRRLDPRNSEAITIGYVVSQPLGSAGAA